jgi:polyhydroxyalkanoate synthase subunit PhaC
MSPSPLHRQRPRHPLRLGPRPLPLHLLAHLSTLLSSSAALPNLRTGSLAWKPHLLPAGKDLERQVAAVDLEQFGHSVAREAGARMADFIEGIEAYRRHSYRRDLPPVPVVWQEGTTRLLAYGHEGAKGPAVLVVPSLVNRAYILDLTRQRSLMRHFADRGLRPFLVDWDAPGTAERDFSLDDYIAGRLARALDAVIAMAGRPALLGYCMGGLLALALAVRRADDIRRLALLATPWDFHAPTVANGRLMTTLRELLEDAINLHGEAPVDLLQAMFALLDPGGIERKFRAFGRLRAGSAKARNFVALEDWLNDGVPLVGTVARETLFGWYGDNSPARGAWLLGGEAVRPERFIKPTLLLVPARDRIVPPASALALAQAMPKATTRLVESGHIGMVSGARAKACVYAPLTKWLTRQDEV